MYMLIAIPFLIYLYYINAYAVNLPRQDDFDAILGFLVKYRQATGADKLWLMFSQHNEHRIFSSRLVYALYYELTGTINFRHIIFIDAAILATLFLLMAGFIRRMVPDNWHVGVLVLSLCLFDMNNYENMNFAMAGMQNFGIVMLFAAALWGYGSNKTVGYATAALLQAIAVFSSGNGLLVAFFLVVYTIVARIKPGMVLSILVFAICVPLYYYHYQKTDNGFFTLEPQKFVPYFMHCLGAHFHKELGVIAAAILLILSVVFLPVQRWFRFPQEGLPVLTMLAFLLASLGVMAIFRANLPVEFAYSSRYFIYSHLVTTIVFVLYLYRFRERKVGIATTVIMLFLIFIAIRNYNDGSKMLVALQHNNVVADYDYPDPGHAKQVCEDACRLNIYCIDQHRIKIQ